MSIGGLLSLGGLAVGFGALLLGAELLLVASVVLAVLGLLVLFVLKLVPRHGRAAARLQLRIANSLGDAQVFLNSPTMAQAMVAQVVADLEWLHSRCDRLVVVAHSQGTVVAHAALTGDHRPWRLEAFCTGGSALTIFDAPRIAAVKVPEDDEHFFPEQRTGDRLLRENLRAQAYWTAAARHFRTLHPTARWLNFWSGCDPVSTGPLSVRTIPGIEEFQVQNTGSFLRDHTAYPNNYPQFVAPLAELVLDAAGISADDALGVSPDRLNDARRAQERLFGLRSRARIVSWVAALVLTLWLLYADAGKSTVAWVAGQGRRLGPRLPGWIGHIRLSHLLVAPVLAAIGIGSVLALYSGAAAVCQNRLNARVVAGAVVSPRAWSVPSYAFNVVLFAICLLPPAVYAAPHLNDLGFVRFAAGVPVTMLAISVFTLERPAIYDDNALEKVCRSLRADTSPGIGPGFGFALPPADPGPEAE